MSPVIIGSVGVSLLLAAFFLNLIKYLSESSKIYLLMNLVGALMAAWYAYSGGIIPFVVLELVWASVALVRLVIGIKKAPAV